MEDIGPIAYSDPTYMLSTKVTASSTISTTAYDKYGPYSYNAVTAVNSTKGEVELYCDTVENSIKICNTYSASHTLDSQYTTIQYMHSVNLATAYGEKLLDLFSVYLGMAVGGYQHPLYVKITNFKIFRLDFDVDSNNQITNIKAITILATSTGQTDISGTKTATIMCPNSSSSFAYPVKSNKTVPSTYKKIQFSN